MKRHFVTFYSPGTFVAEATTLPIKSWSVPLAISMSRGILERHGATPYGFEFSTRERKTKDLDSKTVATSNLYYLGGKVETIDEVRARKDPKEKTLLSNMEINGWKKIVVNDNSWRWTQPYRAGDVVLDMSKTVVY